MTSLTSLRALVADAGPHGAVSVAALLEALPHLATGAPTVSSVLVTPTAWDGEGDLFERAWPLTGDSAARVYRTSTPSARWRWMAYDLHGKLLGTNTVDTPEAARDAADEALTAYGIRSPA